MFATIKAKMMKYMTTIAIFDESSSKLSSKNKPIEMIKTDY